MPMRYQLESALLEQLDELIDADSAWTDGLAAATADKGQGLEEALSSCISGGSYRQLAPARVPQSGSGSRRPPLRQAMPEHLREQDRLLPMANVARLMAGELPKDSKVSRDAKVLMQELLSEFICFLTAEANDISNVDNHKAITPEDQLSALENLGTCHEPKDTAHEAQQSSSKLSV